MTVVAALTVTVGWYMILAAVLFSMGAAGVLLRRNALVMFMSVELMLNSANLALIAFSRALNNLDGHVIVFLVLTVAAAEAAVGLAIIVMLYRNRETINIDRFDMMKG